MKWQDEGIVLSVVERVERSALVALYNAVGWTTYTQNPETLQQAVEASSYVVTATQGERLVGLLRCLSDGHTIVYVQDILVDPDRQRMGLGRALLERCLERYAGVRQKVLLTDDRPSQLAFYASLGFVCTGTLKRTPLNAFVRIEGVELG